MICKLASTAACAGGGLGGGIGGGGEQFSKISHASGGGDGGAGGAGGDGGGNGGGNGGGDGGGDSGGGNGGGGNGDFALHELGFVNSSVVVHVYKLLKASAPPVPSAPPKICRELVRAVSSQLSKL